MWDTNHELRDLLSIEKQKDILLNMNFNDMLQYAIDVSKFLNFTSKAKITRDNKEYQTTTFLTDIINHYPNEFEEKFGVKVISGLESYVSNGGINI